MSDDLARRIENIQTQQQDIRATIEAVKGPVYAHLITIAANQAVMAKAVCTAFGQEENPSEYFVFVHQFVHDSTNVILDELWELAQAVGFRDDASSIKKDVEALADACCKII